MKPQLSLQERMILRAFLLPARHVFFENDFSFNRTSDQEEERYHRDYDRRGMRWMRRKYELELNEIIMAGRKASPAKRLW